ncbi:MAG TPA: hypothetical protein VFZ09_25880 [Archangium sp.]|uniref:hypothetical protein n=1 Tax=Archangium sp. TaxID=1872627 RepID=UPI002E36BAE3|nr:hypothetical protein [Archangium sp.]HEX5749687.1 hypothetical protein [Archangium sp.]
MRWEDRLPGSLLFALVLLLTAPAAAHPQHHGQSAYLTLGRDQVKLELDMSPGTLVAGQVARFIDADGDQHLSEVEQRAYIDALLEDLSLSVDGQALTLVLADARFPSASVLAAGEAQMNFTFTARLPALETGQHRMVFRNDHQFVESSYLAHVFSNEEALVIHEQTRDALYQQLSLEYELEPPVPGTLPAAPYARAGAILLGLVLLAALGGLVERMSARARRSSSSA